MDREKIESLPRNYELLYDVYSGSNPDLTREFMALGSVKTQKALDEIGRKYLPHQHEEGVLAKANSTMQGQMFDFLRLIQDEISSLAEFEKVIEETNRAISSDKDFDRAAFAKSIDKLSKATVQQVKNNRTLGDAAAAQNAAIGDLKKEMDSLEARKWADPVTGLANRRSFNKTVVGVYANPDRPSPCGLVLAEFDDFQNFNTSGEAPFNTQSLQEISGLFKSANTSKQFIAYLDKGRFAFVLNTEGHDPVISFVEALRSAISARRPLVTRKNSKTAQVTFSFGIAMASDATNAGELIQHTEKALSDSLRTGGNKVTIHSLGEIADDRRNYRIYERN